jgi:response regulator NasT
MTTKPPNTGPTKPTHATPPGVKASKPGKDESIPTSFGPCRVLIADDEHLVATGISGSVTELGHKVIGIAPDGEAAVAMARQHKPELALLDIRMPKMTGIEVAMVLQQELGIPSIIVSAYSDEEHVGRIHSYGECAGVYGFLLKPVSKEELRVTIGVALQRSAVDNHNSTRIHQLENNLVNRRTVEAAKWILVQKTGITEPQAHEKMQRAARDRRKPLVEIAQIVIATGELAE